MNQAIQIETVGTSSRQAWFLVGFMWVAFFLDYSDRQVVYSLFPVLKSDLGFTDTQLGMLGSIALWVYAFCSPVAGQIADRFSKPRLIVLSLVCWSGVTALTGLSNSALMLVICQAIVAVIQPFFIPAAVALIASVHGPKTRSRAMAVFATAQLAGAVMGGWFGGLVAQKLHWRLAFSMLGVMGIAYALPYWRFLKTIGEEPCAETKEVEGKLAAAVLARVPSYLALSLASCAFSVAYALLYAWLPNFLYEKFSLGLAEAGFTATVYLQSTTLVGVLCGGWIADSLYSRTRAARLWLACIGLIFSSPFVHVLGNSDSLFFTKIAALAYGFCIGLFVANLTVSSFEVIPANTRASAAGLFNFTGGIFSGFTALLAGIWKESVGIPRMMTYAAFICGAAGLLQVVAIKLFFQRDYDRVH